MTARLTPADSQSAGSYTERCLGGSIPVRASVTLCQLTAFRTGRNYLAIRVGEVLELLVTTGASSLGFDWPNHVGNPDFSRAVRYTRYSLNGHN